MDHVPFGVLGVEARRYSPFMFGSVVGVIAAAAQPKKTNRAIFHCNILSGA